MQAAIISVKMCLAIIIPSNSRASRFSAPARFVKPSSGSTQGLPRRTRTLKQSARIIVAAGNPATTEHCIYFRQEPAFTSRQRCGWAMAACLPQRHAPCQYGRGRPRNARQRQLPAARQVPARSPEQHCPMNFRRAISSKLVSVLLFAVMSALVRHVGETVPLGQVVFFRSAFAFIPVMVIYAWRGEVGAAFRTGRPFGHITRGLIAVVSMFLNFAPLARLPLVDATAIAFAAPFITVALAALVLKERVRAYRW